MGAFKIEQKLTFADYKKMDDGQRWELIDGSLVLMSPAPSTSHQRILARLVYLFQHYLNGKTCQVFPAPFDVRLTPQKGDITVVQPDLSVICDPTKLDEGGCVGAPDLVIEILSKSTARMDKLIKFNKYQETGVLEYWIVDPATDSVEVYLLNNCKFDRYFYSELDLIPVHIFEEMTVDLGYVFALT